MTPKGDDGPAGATSDLLAARDAADAVGGAAVVLAAGGGRTGAAGARPVLPRVLADVPVAILLVDQGSGLVTYTDAAATRMASDLVLPARVDAWARAAGLTGLEGEPLAETNGPLSEVAAGRPADGEAVRAPQTSLPDAQNGGGRAGGAGDRWLWATGFPLSRPDSAERLSLVVLQEVSPPVGAADPQETMRALRERAIVATDVGFTISDPAREDNPLVWVNPAFTAMTGYPPEEVLGRNCRFLQGPGTDPAQVAEIAEALAERRSVTTVLLDHRKDGTAFWNQLSVTPVFDARGQLVSYVGVQADVTERVEADRDLAAAHRAERAARGDAEAARQRYLLLAEATSLLSATLDVEESLDRLVRLVVPLLADWAVVSLVDDDGELRVGATRHRDGREDVLATYVGKLGGALAEGSLQRQVQRSGEPVLVRSFESVTATDDVEDPVIQSARELGLGSGVVVPLTARRQVLGALALIFGPSGRTSTVEDLGTATDLGRRAGLALDNARLYQREHRTAETLQANMLPVLPDVAGLGVAVAYLAGDAAASVGGDFYEVLDLPDKTVAVAVGDVVGHDMTAAVQMGQLRSHLRGCAWQAATTATTGTGDPALVISALDRLVQGLQVAPMASLFYLSLTRPAARGGDWTLAYTDAGHPHALLRHPDGTSTELDQADGLLLGVADTDRRTAQVSVPAGSQLILFTDGLIERRDADLDQGVAALLQAVAELPARATPEHVRDALVTHAGPDRGDDVAVLVVALA